MEIWKDIKDYPGYQVSNLGNVRTHNKLTYTKKHGIRRWKDRILKQKIQKKDKCRKDKRVELWKEGKHKTFLVSRLVAFTFYDMDINSKLTVNHKDGNPLNNNINNLEIITLKENIQHAFKNGLNNCSKKIKIENKINGNIVYANSLLEGSKLINKGKGYLSLKIKRNSFENKQYRWELI